MAEITIADKLACAQREVRLRVERYAHDVEQGRMTAAWAEFQIACMRAIADDYAQQIQAAPAEAPAAIPPEKDTP